MQTQAEEFRALAIRAQRVLADEVAGALEVHGPGEARVQRRDVLIHVLAIQVHAGFEAQRVARSQAARAHAGSRQRIPRLDGARSGNTASKPSSPYSRFEPP
jgi:hypothetical protein